MHRNGFRLTASAATTAALLLALAAHAMTSPKLQPSFYWVSSGPLIRPQPEADPPVVAIKDPSVVRFGGRWHLFATTVDRHGRWSMVYTSFADWADAPTAKLRRLDANPALAGYHCAPEVFYFEPQGLWYLVFQSPDPSYSTTADIGDPLSWSAPRPFFHGTPKTVVEGWIDFWVICDSTHACLFFSDDHGRYYRSRTSLSEFPAGFSDPVVIMHEPDARDLFEGSCVYRVKGEDRYLALIECIGPDWHRYYKGFVADRLDGDWRPLAATWREPFAAITHVRFAEGVKPWTNDISHGELLRDGYDQTLTVDPAHLALLFQGVRPELAQGKQYYQLPYELGLLRPDTDLAPAAGEGPAVERRP